MRAPSGSIGLVAGAGRLPIEAARLLESEGRSVVALGFEGLTDPELAAHTQRMDWVTLGQLDAMAEALADLGARELLLLGKVSKTLLFSGESAVPVVADAEATRLLAGQSDHGDDSLLRSIASWLESKGFVLAAPQRLLEGLLVVESLLTERSPDTRERADFEYGWPVLCRLGDVGVGQCVVVKAGATLAVEAIEGTDETIRRAGRFGGSGGTVIKALRSGQDLRLDLPAVGPGTIEAMAEAGATALALEAGVTLIVERESFLAEADRRGIAVWGFVRGQEHS